MFRNLALTASVTILVGFVFGWLAFSNSRLHSARIVAASPAPGLKVPEASVSVDVVQRFALRPADASADRETTAIAVAPTGSVVLAWASQAEPGASSRTLYVARSSDGFHFGAPVAWRSVPTYKFTSGDPAKGRKMAFSTHVVPRLASTVEGVMLGWVEAIEGGPAVKYLVAGSLDGGATFSEPIAVHGDAASRPGFTALAANTEGSVAFGWLDGRDGVQQPYFRSWPFGSEEFGPEQRVYDGPEGKGICPCCDVAVAITPDRGAFVAFRNSDAGHRDIWLARAGAGTGAGAAFSAPIPVAREPWTFDGCPHDGPSLALAGDRLHVAWMDAHTGTNRVYHAASPVDDPSFQPRPLNAQGPGAQGHPRMAVDAEGALHVVWDEGLGPEPTAAEAKSTPPAGHAHHHAAPTAGGAGRAIMYAVSRDGGASFTPAHALAPSPGAYQTQPSLAVGRDGIVNVAWSEYGAEGKSAVYARLARPSKAKEPRRP